MSETVKLIWFQLNKFNIILGCSHLLDVALIFDLFDHNIRLVTRYNTLLVYFTILFGSHSDNSSLANQWSFNHCLKRETETGHCISVTGIWQSPCQGWRIVCSNKELNAVTVLHLLEINCSENHQGSHGKLKYFIYFIFYYYVFSSWQSKRLPSIRHSHTVTWQWWIGIASTNQ